MNPLFLFLPLLFAAFQPGSPASPEPDYDGALRTILLTEDVRHFFRDQEIPFIEKNEKLCEKIDCENFILTKTGQTVFFAAKPELFMRQNPPHLFIEEMKALERVQVKYAVRYQLRKMAYIAEPE